MSTDPVQPPATAPADPADPRATAPASDVPRPGHRWGGDYFVETVLEDPTGAAAWKAIDLRTGNSLQLRMLRSADPQHNEAWARLEGLSSPRLLKALGERTVGDLRVELFVLPPGPPLRTWRAANAGAVATRVPDFLRDMAEAIATLHEGGLVHCHIDPDSFFVEEGGDRPHLVLGHLERAALWTRNDLLPVSSDPFYAPPEAAGLYRHSGGDGLLAWDWWSIGRVLQEFILGHHVFEVILKHDLNHAGLQEREYAEKFLLEKVPGEYRPGAVEVMSGLGDRVELLLRGLLTTVRDARWGAVDVTAWLGGQSPRERYSLGRNERVFRWHGRAYTTHEAAEAMQKAEHWDEAAGQILNGAPGTLAAFVHEVQSLRQQAHKLDEALKLLSDPELEDFPREAVEEMVLALALHQLAGGSLVWRGRRVDAACLREALQKEDGSGHQLACVWTLASVPFIASLEKTDAEALRILLDGSRLAKRCVEKAWKQGWLSQNDVKGIARVWELAFSAPHVWQEARAELRSHYACSTIPEIDHLYQNERPSNDDALLLTLLAPRAERLGFLTHEEWARRQYELLFAKGRRISTAIFWKRLARILRYGPWCIGHLGWLITGWAAIAILIAAGWPGPRLLAAAFVPGALAALLRLGLLSLLKHELSHHAPGSPPWRFRDGPARCAAATLGTPEHNDPLPRLEEELAEIDGKIAGLTRLQPPPPRLPKPSALREIWMFAGLSWALWLGIIGLCSWRFHVHPPTWKGFVSAWSSESEAKVEKDVKVAWPYKQPDYVRKVEAAETRDAESAEVALAESRGRSYTADYVRSTIASPILVEVPSDHLFAFIVYDGRKDSASKKTVYLLPYQPQHGAWMELDGMTVMAP